MFPTLMLYRVVHPISIPQLISNLPLQKSGTQPSPFAAHLCDCPILACVVSELLAPTSPRNSFTNRSIVPTYSSFCLCLTDSTYFPSFLGQPLFSLSTISEVVSCICDRVTFFGHNLCSILGPPGFHQDFLCLIYFSRAPSDCCLGTELQGVELGQEDRQAPTQHVGEGRQGLDLCDRRGDENVYLRSIAGIGG